jgi:hypothetical protein
MRKEHKLIMQPEKKQPDLSSLIKKELSQAKPDCEQDFSLQFIHEYYLSFEGAIYSDYNGKGNFDGEPSDAPIDKEKTDCKLLTSAITAWDDFATFVTIGCIAGQVCENLNDIEWEIEKEINGVSPSGVPEIEIYVKAKQGTVSFGLMRIGYTGLPIEPTFSARATARLFGRELGTLTFSN